MVLSEALCNLCPFRLPSTPLGQVMGVKSVQLQKAAGPAEVQSAVSNSSEARIPVVDTHGTQRAVIYTHSTDSDHTHRKQRQETCGG